MDFLLDFVLLMNNVGMDVLHGGFIYYANNIEDRSDESEDEVANTSNQRFVQDTTRLVENDINYITRQASGIAYSSDQQNVSIIPVIQRRSLKPDSFTTNEKCRLRNSLLPNKPCIVKNYNSKVFCGLYSKDGKFFITATQDKRLQMYHTCGDRIDLYKEIQACDVGWSILDIAFSPDGRHIAYSSWSESLYQVSLHGCRNWALEKLQLSPIDRRFCVFSIVFSYDGREIFGGANNGYIYIYDRECNRQILRFSGHSKDVNTVAIADNISQIFYSGSDDGLCKVWDRRLISETNSRPVGVLVGHNNGITHIDSRGDGRYLISNSKDQSIKLWDIRKCSSHRAEEIARQFVNRQHWDYRWQRMPEIMREPQVLDGDTSVMTYYGHCVRKTLIRCRFSPNITTGQKYISTGDSRGRLIIYDLLTGKIVLNIRGHRGCVRDVSWHPYNHNIYTSSWDGKIVKWSDRDETNINMNNQEDEEVMVNNVPQLRRSERIAEQRRAC
ncbi:DDB1- and CUL4-associated factor 11 isoform X2 [Camponotus floridanus]|uniref:DDB1- and CUL4-associated factor 11 isoform X2 n=1 Tax=Camponotus floridanus TaxID=104421 RepID=UPI00059DC52E|nr:DDB1- and CUL4-associated factor 11 isoform X2 [Camponotus floridanus]